MSPKQSTAVVESPIGPLRVVADDDALRRIDHVGDGSAIAEPSGPIQHPVLARAVEQLREYFAGERRTFDLPLAPQGTDFQRRVWRELQTLSYGVTISYRQLAERLGDLKAIRAAGRANGQNPISVVIPCHRVIGADGSLTGYAGGLDRKRLLLEIEGAAPATLFSR